jgi:regulator of extracellular matrix RemA (YlzA/DUF370 family)
MALDYHIRTTRGLSAAWKQWLMRPLMLRARCPGGPSRGNEQMRRIATWATAARLALGVTAAGALTGCDGKIAQCNRLIDVINTEQAPLKNAMGDDPSTLKKLAETLEGVAKKVRAVQIKDPKLIAFRDEYAKMAEELATAARETAAAYEGNDEQRVAESGKKMKSFEPREKKLVSDINGYCSGSN